MTPSHSITIQKYIHKNSYIRNENIETGLMEGRNIEGKNNSIEAG